MLPGLSSVMVGVGGGGDVVPDAVSWTDIIFRSIYEPYGYTNSQAISGIITPIYLRAEVSGYSGAAGAVSFTVSASSGGISAADGAYIDFLVSPDQLVSFAAAWTDIASFTATVKYKSAGSSTFDQTLDTFDVSPT